MDRARTAALAGHCPPRASLALPGVRAGVLGLSEPRRLWQRAPGAGALAAALAHRRPLAALALTAALLPADVPAEPSRRARPGRVPGAGARPRAGHHRASGELFVSVDHCQLRFYGDARLVAKDVVPCAGGRRGVAHEEFTR